MSRKSRVGSLRSFTSTPGPVLLNVRDPMRQTSLPQVLRVGWSTVTACSIVATCALLFGCQPPTTPPLGGNSPVTIQRLSGARLTDIREPLSWRFNNSVVIIEYEGQPIPSDVVEALLGERPAAVRIEASWRLDEEAGTLLLSDVKADEESIEKEVNVTISPAGHIRVNLGSRQYNVFRDSANDP